MLRKTRINRITGHTHIHGSRGPRVLTRRSGRSPVERGTGAEPNRATELFEHALACVALPPPRSFPPRLRPRICVVSVSSVHRGGALARACWSNPPRCRGRRVHKVTVCRRVRRAYAHYAGSFAQHLESRGEFVRAQGLYDDAFAAHAECPRGAPAPRKPPPREREREREREQSRSLSLFVGGRAALRRAGSLSGTIRSSCRARSAARPRVRRRCSQL